MTAAPGVPGEGAGTSAEGFDPESGFVLPARFAMRIRDALGSGGSPLLVVSFQVENADQLARHNRGHALRALLQLGDCLRSELPFSHTVARTGKAELSALLPNAGSDPDALAKRLAAAVARRITSDAGVNFPTPVVLAFGFARAPRDGADAEVLLREARRPRLRTRPRATQG